jgi:hypothetical protein
MSTKGCEKTRDSKPTLLHGEGFGRGQTKVSLLSWLLEEWIHLHAPQERAHYQQSIDLVLGDVYWAT